jgi:hypothetical protein
MVCQPKASIIASRGRGGQSYTTPLSEMLVVVGDLIRPLISDNPG